MDSPRQSEAVQPGVAGSDLRLRDARLALRLPGPARNRGRRDRHAGHRVVRRPLSEARKIAAMAEAGTFPSRLTTAPARSFLPPRQHCPERSERADPGKCARLSPNWYRDLVTALPRSGTATSLCRRGPGTRAELLPDLAEQRFTMTARTTSANDLSGALNDATQSRPRRKDRPPDRRTVARRPRAGAMPGSAWPQISFSLIDRTSLGRRAAGLRIRRETARPRVRRGRDLGDLRGSEAKCAAR
jgi:hypothetical protein